MSHLENIAKGEPNFEVGQQKPNWLQTDLCCGQVDCLKKAQYRPIKVSTPSTGTSRWPTWSKKSIHIIQAIIQQILTGRQLWWPDLNADSGDTTVSKRNQTLAPPKSYLVKDREINQIKKYTVSLQYPPFYIRRVNQMWVENSTIKFLSVLNIYKHFS
jgi:hypothetical protein